MRRIERIRQKVVSKALAQDGLVDDPKPDTDRMIGDYTTRLFSRRMADQRSGRHRQIVERLLDLSTRDLTE